MITPIYGSCYIERSHKNIFLRYKTLCDCGTIEYVTLQVIRDRPKEIAARFESIATSQMSVAHLIEDGFPAMDDTTRAEAIKDYVDKCRFYFCRELGKLGLA